MLRTSLPKARAQTPRVRYTLSALSQQPSRLLGTLNALLLVSVSVDSSIRSIVASLSLAAPNVLSSSKTLPRSLGHIEAATVELPASTLHLPEPEHGLTVIGVAISLLRRATEAGQVGRRPISCGWSPSESWPACFRSDVADTAALVVAAAPRHDAVRAETIVSDGLRKERSRTFEGPKQLAFRVRCFYLREV